MTEKYEKIEAIKEALQKSSFKSNCGQGARVCYPNEVLVALYGKGVLTEHYIKE